RELDRVLVHLARGRRSDIVARDDHRDRHGRDAKPGRADKIERKGNEKSSASRGGHLTINRLPSACEQGEARRPGRVAGRAAVVMNSHLTVTEVCTLALLAAVEMDVNRQRLVAYLNDDVAARWITASTLRLLTPDPVDLRDALLAVGPGGGLRRACLLRTDAAAGWAHAPLRLHANVVWWLL